VTYVSLSGGADSTALAILLKERGEEFEMVFADTGAELPET
jgi:3'-phosphoadenosine 5'-phosphosulfate sulfotransferase (PAPS reductase)/FAD synthetase